MPLEPPAGVKPVPFKTHNRTITETDIVTFVNVVGLHEPFFIDMEYIKNNMSGRHRNRFAPGPMIISVGMGLLAPTVAGIIDKVLEGREHGPFGGMTGVQAREGRAVPGRHDPRRGRGGCARPPRAATR